MTFLFLDLWDELRCKVTIQSFITYKIIWDKWKLRIEHRCNLRVQIVSWKKNNFQSQPLNKNSIKIKNSKIVCVQEGVNCTGCNTYPIQIWKFVPLTLLSINHSFWCKTCFSPSIIDWKFIQKCFVCVHQNYVEIHLPPKLKAPQNGFMKISIWLCENGFRALLACF